LRRAKTKIRESRAILKQAQAARMRNDGDSIKDIAKTLKVDRSFVYRAVFYFKRLLTAKLNEKKSPAKRKRQIKSREKLNMFIDKFLNKKSLSNVTVPKIISSARGS